MKDFFAALGQVGGDLRLMDAIIQDPPFPNDPVVLPWRLNSLTTPFDVADRGLHSATQAGLDTADRNTQDAIAEARLALQAAAAEGVPQTTAGLNALDQLSDLLGLARPEQGFAAQREQGLRSVQFERDSDIFQKALAGDLNPSSLRGISTDLRPEFDRIAAAEIQERDFIKRNEKLLAERNRIAALNTRNATLTQNLEEDMDLIAKMASLVLPNAVVGNRLKNQRGYGDYDYEVKLKQKDVNYRGKYGTTFNMELTAGVVDGPTAFAELESNFTEYERTSELYKSIRSDLLTYIRGEVSGLAAKAERQNYKYSNGEFLGDFGAGAFGRQDISDAAFQIITPILQKYLREQGPTGRQFSAADRATLSDALSSVIQTTDTRQKNDMVDMWISAKEIGNLHDAIHRTDLYSALGRTIAGKTTALIKGIPKEIAETFKPITEAVTNLAKGIRFNTSLSSQVERDRTFTTLGQSLQQDLQKAGEVASLDAQQLIERQVQKLPELLAVPTIDEQAELQTLKGSFVGEKITSTENPDRQATALETLRATPGFQFAMEEGLKATERSAAAKGGLLSGATQKSLTEFGQGLADQQFQQTLENLQQVVGLGSNIQQQQANREIANAGLLSGILSDDTTQKGNILGQFQQGQQNLVNSLSGAVSGVGQAAIAGAAVRAAATTAANASTANSNNALLGSILSNPAFAGKNISISN